MSEFEEYQKEQRAKECAMHQGVQDGKREVFRRSKTIYSALNDCHKALSHHCTADTKLVHRQWSLSRHKWGLFGGRSSLEATPHDTTATTGWNLGGIAISTNKDLWITYNAHNAGVRNIMAKGHRSEKWEWELHNAATYWSSGTCWYRLDLSEIIKTFANTLKGNENGAVHSRMKVPIDSVSVEDPLFGPHIDHSLQDWEFSYTTAYTDVAVLKTGGLYGEPEQTLEQLVFSRTDKFIN